MNQLRQRRAREARLYGIVDLGYTAPDDCVAVTRSLLAGGVDILQLRAKNHEEPEICRLARLLVPVCHDYGVPFVVNDFTHVALEAGADGVHLGQEDGDLAGAAAALPG